MWHQQRNKWQQQQAAVPYDGSSIAWPPALPYGGLATMGAGLTHRFLATAPP